MPLSGYSADLPADLLMDTGILYAGTTLLGATRGAPRFDPGKEMSNIDFDGKRTDIMGLDRVDRYNSVISATLIEFDAADIARFEPGATNSGTDPVVYVPKDAGTLFASGDYITDLRLIFERGGGGYACIHFPRAIVQRWQVAGNKNDIGLIECEFKAVLNMGSAAISDPPYNIETRTALPS